MKFYVIHFTIRLLIGLAVGLIGLLVSYLTGNWAILFNVFGLIGFALLAGPAIFGGTFRIGVGGMGGHNVNSFIYKMRPDLRKHVDEDQKRGFSFGLSLMTIGLGVCLCVITTYFLLR